MSALLCDVCGWDPRGEGPPWLDVALADEGGAKPRCIGLRLVCAGCRRRDNVGGPLGRDWRAQLAYYSETYEIALDALVRVWERLAEVEATFAHARSSLDGFGLCGALAAPAQSTTHRAAVSCGECQTLLQNLDQRPSLQG